MRLTYRRLIRQIFVVLRVAMPQIPSTVGKRLISRLQSQSRYSTARPSKLPFERVGTGFLSKTGLGEHA